MTLNKNIFRDYAALKVNEKEVVAEIKALQPELMAEIEKTPEKAVAAEFGNFSLTSRKTYKYSPAVTIAEEALDNIKADEVANGKATFTESKSVRFEAPKKAKEE